MNGVIFKLAVGGTLLKIRQPRDQTLPRPPITLTLTRFSLTLHHPSMTAAPSDAFQVSSSTALEMAEGLMRTLNTIIKHLPEHELRTMRDTLEISLYTADDLLIGMTLPSDLETLTINGSMYG